MGVSGWAAGWGEALPSRRRRARSRAEGTQDVGRRGGAEVAERGSEQERARTCEANPCGAVEEPGAPAVSTPAGHGPPAPGASPEPPRTCWWSPIVVEALETGAGTRLQPRSRLRGHVTAVAAWHAYVRATTSDSPRICSQESPTVSAHMRGVAPHICTAKTAYPPRICFVGVWLEHFNG